MKMKKSLLFLAILVLAISIFSYFSFEKKTNAQYTGGSGGGYASASISVFGGKIANTKAERVAELENQGYYCNYSGTTIEVTPVRSTMPYSYAIPAGVKSKTGFSLRDGQWILGKYNGETTITCPNEDPEIPPQTVTLSEISIYGTSKM